jgi:toxin secretion/phage lysis holin
MMDYLGKIKIIIAALGGALTALLGGWDLMLQVLVGFVVADYITGLIAAWYEKKLNSDVGLRGIAKKVLLFVPVAIGFWLDQILGQEILRNLSIWFYIANEGLSILENLTTVGVPFPPALADALEQLKAKEESHAE